MFCKFVVFCSRCETTREGVTRQVFGMFGNVVFCGSFLLGEGMGVSSDGNDAENILFA